MKRVGILVGREKTFPEALIKNINERGSGSVTAEFMTIGGVAASIQGLDQATFELDICYARHRGNLERLAQAHTALHARLHNAAPELPCTPDAETLRRGLNFTLNIDLSPLDLFGEVSGVGTFEQAIAASETIELHGRRYAVFSLLQLIAAKRAA